MTMVPSIGTESITARIASTATWSDLWRSPWPIVCAHAIAACSTTRRNSSERSESICCQPLRCFRCLAIRRQFATRGPVGSIAEQIVGLHHLVNLARALVDDRALAVAEEAPDRILVGVAVRAVNLDGVAGGALRRDGREPLRQAGLAGVAQTLVLEPARADPQQARGLIVRFHLRDHLLHELVLADLHAEGPALPGVFDARVAARAD